MSPNAACTATLVKLSRHVKSRGPDPTCSSDRQEHRKAGPLARSALHLDVAAVRLYQRLGDKKPESRSFLLSSGLAALVFLKKRGNLFWCYSQSGVGNRPNHLAVLQRSVDRHSSQLGSELEGIVQQVGKDPLQGQGIPFN